MASGRFADYIGQGNAGDRPVSLTLYAESFGLYYAEDTGDLSLWDGTAWLPLDTTSPASLPDAVNDAAAASAGVAVGERYRNGSALMVRIA